MGFRRDPHISAGNKQLATDRLRAAIGTIAICLLLSVTNLRSASAADFNIVTPDLISMKGLIAANDCERWQKALRPGIKYVMLNSNGGLVGQGECISRSIFKLRLKTIVLEKCASICFLLFAAGAQKSVCAGGQVGVHRPVDVKTKQEDSDPQFLQLILEYAHRYGVPDAITQRLSKTSGQEIYFLTDAELALMGAKDCA